MVLVLTQQCPLRAHAPDGRVGRIESVDVVLPLEKRELRLRCVVRPDKAQAALLDRLGLRLPKRSKPPRPLSEM